MTGGQGSPTTPGDASPPLPPAGCAETPFDLCELAIAAGANYVSRWTSYHVKELEKAVKVGLETPASPLSRHSCNARLHSGGATSSGRWQIMWSTCGPIPCSR